MKLWIVFTAVILCTTNVLSEHNFLEQHYADAHEAAECRDYCENAGVCGITHGTKTCQCRDFNFTLADGTQSKTSFYGDTCQYNFYQCFFEESKKNCLINIAAIYHNFESLLKEYKFVSACRLLDSVIDCLGKGFKHCNDHNENAETDKEIANYYQNKLNEWVQEQSVFCKSKKYARGDDCCHRTCKEYDEERLCQCNNACRRYGDCCYKKGRLCPWRKANDKEFVSDSPPSCPRLNGTVCPTVVLKANETMQDILNAFRDMQGYTIVLDNHINATLNKKLGYIPKYTPKNNITLKDKELFQEHMELLMSAYKPISSGDPAELENPEPTHCGNCTRTQCVDPCPKKEECPCKAYPDATCFKDSCILEPCDATLHCVPRWFIQKEVGGSKKEWFEVTLSCPHGHHECKEDGTHYMP